MYGLAETPAVAGGRGTGNSGEGVGLPLACDADGRCGVPPGRGGRAVGRGGTALAAAEPCGTEATGAWVCDRGENSPFACLAGNQSGIPSRQIMSVGLSCPVVASCFRAAASKGPRFWPSCIQYHC